MVFYCNVNNVLSMLPSCRLFSGVVPRTLWIFLGGYIFFGSYDYAKNSVFDFLEERSGDIR